MGCIATIFSGVYRPHGSIVDSIVCHHCLDNVIYQGPIKQNMVILLDSNLPLKLQSAQ